MHTTRTGAGRLVIALAMLTAASCTSGGPASPVPSSTPSPAPGTSASPTAAATPTRDPSPSPSPSQAAAVTPSPTPTLAPTPVPSVPSTPSVSPTATPPAAPTKSPAGSPSAAAAVCVKDPELDAFARGLLADLSSRKERRIAARVAKRFSFVAEATDVDPLVMTPAEAAAAMVDGLGEPFVGYRPLVAGSRIRCVRHPTAAVRDLGAWMLDGAYDAKILTRGWGPDGDEEAFLYLVRRADGSIVWKAVLYSLAGFRQ
jgi:hypothetical protein